MQRKRLHVLWAACCLASLQYAAAQLSIARYLPNRGSIAGGTKLELQGTGFSENTRIFIGPFECDVDNASITSISVQCFTRPAPDYATYNLTVTDSSTGQSFKLCCFSFQREVSPSLMLVDPSAGPPDTSPTLVGEYTGTLYWYWSNRESSGRTDYIGQITFGEYNCYFSDQAGSDVFVPNVDSYNIQLLQLRQDGTYRLKCDLPNPDNTWTFQSGGHAGLGVAGNLNVSLHFEQDFRSGLAVAKAPVYVPSRDGVPHMFQLHARVDAVTPNTGSIAGGTLLTIKGSGFPSAADLTSSRATLDIKTAAGATCKVIASDYNIIQCITSPQPKADGSGSGAEDEDETDNAAAAPGAGVVWPGGLMVGSRGWVYDVFTNSMTQNMDANPTGSKSMAQAAATWSVSNTSLNGTRYTFTDRFEGRNTSSAKMLTRGMAYFIAPKAGRYSFAMIGDDMIQLLGLWHNGSAWQRKTLVGINNQRPLWTYCNQYEWGCKKSECWEGTSSRCSANPTAANSVELQAGQPLLLAANHWNGDWSGSWQVGVRVPSKEPGFFSIPEVQRVFIPYTQIQHRQVLSVLFRPPADAGIKVTISVAAGDGTEGPAAAGAGVVSAAAGALVGPLAKLNDPRIGVSLTVLGVQVPVFAPNISATALQTLITKALNGSTVGVERIQNPDAGTLTYLLMTNRTVFMNDLPPADISAQLIVLPVNGSTTGSTTGSSTAASTGRPYTCLKLVSEPKTVSYTDTDGTVSNKTVVEEVWRNVTISPDSSTSSSTEISNSSSSEDGSSSSDLFESPAPDNTTEGSSSSTDVVDILAGIGIAVGQPLEPPDMPGGIAQGAWQLLLEGQDKTVDLPWNVTASDLQTAARSLQGNTYVTCRDPALSGKENCVWRDGYLTGRSWIVFWGIEVQDEVTHFTAQPQPGGYAPDYMITAAGQLQLASPPLSGSVTVGFRDYCDTVELGIADTAYGLANKLNSLPGIKGVLVRVDGNSFNAMSWTLTYNPYSNPGPQPLLRLVSTANLAGNPSPVTVTRFTEGSTDFFYGPIPGDMLRQPVDALTAKAVGANAFPSSTVAASASSSSSEALQLLDVVVNSVLSTYNPAGSNMRACAFRYDAAMTPAVNSVNPVSLTAGQRLTIEGAGFAAGTVMANRVWVGGAPCTVVSATATQLQCTTADNTTAGEQEVHVTVEGKGDAQAMSDTSTSPNSLGAPFLVNVTAQEAAVLSISSITPSALSLNSITLLNLGLKNLPGFVLQDHSGEVPVAGASYSQLTGFYSASFGSSSSSSSYLYSGDAFKAAIATASSTSNCKRWLSLSIAGVGCPICSCKGNTSEASIIALFPGHLVNASAVDQSGSVNATLTVVNAAGSTVVTRRRLAALRHPPLLHIPQPVNAPALLSESYPGSSTVEQSGADADHGFVSDLFEQLEDVLDNAAAAGAGLWQNVQPRLQGLWETGKAVVPKLWKQYVQTPNEEWRFHQQVRLQGSPRTYTSATMPPHLGLRGQLQSTTPHGAPRSSIWQAWTQQQQQQHDQQRSPHSRRLLATTESQTAAIAKASTEVLLSATTASVALTGPDALRLQTYGQTTLVFEVSGIDVSSVLQARVVPVSATVATSILQAVAPPTPSPAPKPSAELQDVDVSPSPEPGSPEPGSPEPKTPETPSSEPQSPEPKSPEPGSPEPEAPETPSSEPRSPKPNSPEPGSPVPLPTNKREGAPPPADQADASQLPAADGSAPPLAGDNSTPFSAETTSPSPSPDNHPPPPTEAPPPANPEAPTPTSPDTTISPATTESTPAPPADNTNPAPSPAEASGTPAENTTLLPPPPGTSSPPPPANSENTPTPPDSTNPSALPPETTNPPTNPDNTASPSADPGNTSTPPDSTNTPAPPPDNNSPPPSPDSQPLPPATASPPAEPESTPTPPGDATPPPSQPETTTAPATPDNTAPAPTEPTSYPPGGGQRRKLQESEASSSTDSWMVSDAAGLAAGWNDQQYTCRNLTLLNDTHVSCQTGPVPHGTYALVVSLSTQDPGIQLQLAAPQSLYSILSINSVSPPLGSIGGGTLLTISGAGFDAADPTSNVVVVPVPVSTSYPNGAVLCDVVKASYSTLKCRTRPHLAADANANDPMARARLPTESPPSVIQLARCSSPSSSSSSSSSSRNAGMISGNIATSSPMSGSGSSNSSTSGYGLASVDADVNALTCWSDRQISALAVCEAGPGESCTYTYSFSATPRVDSVLPSVLPSTVNGATEPQLTVIGSFVLNAPVRVLLLPYGASPEAIAAAAKAARNNPGSSSGSSSRVEECKFTSGNDTAVVCQLPADLLPGSWQAIVMHDNGELSVTNNPAAAAAAGMPLTVAEAAALATAPPVFQLRPVLSALSTHWTGVSGGTMLNVTLDSGSAAFDVANPDSNQVLIGGVPCVLDPSTLEARSVTVATPPVVGRYMAEYWQLPVDTWSMPNFDGLGPAHTRRVELLNSTTGLSFGINAACGGTCRTWGGQGPAGLDASTVDHWAVRLSCYLRLPTGGNTTLWVSVDDQVRIEAFDLKDKVVLNRTVGIGSGQIVLPAMPPTGGQLYMVLNYVEHSGAAFLGVTWDGPAPGNSSWAQTPIRPQSVSLVPTGGPLAIDVQVNGVVAMPNCSQTSHQTSPLTALIGSIIPAPGLTQYGEPWQLTAKPCESFVLSSLLAPSIAGLLTPNTVNATNTVLSLPLLLAEGVSVDDLVVNIGGKFASNMQLLVNNTTGLNTPEAAAAVLITGAVPAAGLYTLRCTAPNLPAGVYTFQLIHASWGAATLEPSIANISVTYTPSIASVSPVANISSFGGITLNISGFGFAPMIKPAMSADSLTFSTNSSTGSNNSRSTAEPGSLTTRVLDHYAVASTPLPPAAPGVLGNPLIPWDLTQPASVQHLAPHNPPGMLHVTAAGLVVARTSVKANGMATACMVLEATETWVACRLQRSSTRLQDNSNFLQVSVLGLDNKTRTVSIKSPQLSYMYSSSWYVRRVAQAGTGSTTLNPLEPVTLNLTMVVPSALAILAASGEAAAAAAAAAGVAASAAGSTEDGSTEGKTNSSTSGNTNSSTTGTTAPVPPSVGFPSLASNVFVVCSRRVYQCTNPTVLAAPADYSAAATYQEMLSCVLPDTGMPASTNCEAVVELPGLGFSGPVTGSNAKLTVGLTIDPGYPQPASGSMAGGQAITISGKGFDVYNSSAVRVTLKKIISGQTYSAPCTPTYITPTAVTCVTGIPPAAACPNTSSMCTFSISIIPSDSGTTGGGEFTSPSFGTYTYSVDLTPSITGISPSRGSTEGGTLVTITGSSLNPVFAVALPAGGRKLKGGWRSLLQTASSTSGTSSTGISVTIGGVPCTNVVLRNAEGTSVTCETGRPVDKLGVKPQGPQSVIVTVEGKGSAAGPAGGNITYEYVDVWSRRTTWGGLEPPVFNDSVIIPAGTTVMLDVSPPRLYMLLIEGTLLIDPTAPLLELQAHYILLRGGTFRAGSSIDKPHPGKLTITLWGDKELSRRLPTFGAKVLANLDGTIQLFGAAVAVPSWTQLNASADIGHTSIVVNGQVNWSAGFTIAIASSSFDAREVDTAVITAVQVHANGTSKLALDRPLHYTHLGVLRTYAGDPRQHALDMRAEVTVLDRNIVIQGDPSTAVSMYGAHVMSTWSKRVSNPKPTMQLGNVELRQVGQAFQMGRYPIHFHMIGDVSFQSWISNCSIHHTWNRAITVHGTQQVRIMYNSAFATTGHTYFLEDGVEWGNWFEGNLGMLTQVSNGMLITDNNPATFWVTHPNNTYIGNAAAGSLEGFGFWYHLEDYPTGPSKTYSICPKYEKMGVFRNNVAHSNSFYGLRIHPEFYYKDCPCCSSYNLLPAVFEGLIGYKNGVNCIVATQVGTVQFHNMTCADSGAGIKMLPVNGKDSGSHYEIIFEVDQRPRLSTPLTSMAGLFNALAVAQTEEGLRGSLVPWPSDRWIAAVTTPQTLLGAWQHHAHMAIVNFTIAGFAGHSHAGSEFRSLETCAHCKDDTGGNTAFTRGLTFLPPSATRAVAPTAISASPEYGKYYDPAIAKPRLFNYSWAHQGIIVDTDGSLVNAVTITAPAGVSGGAWTLSDCRAFTGAAADFDVGSTPVPLGGCSVHSGHLNGLFRANECHRMTEERGFVCRPGITYRRIMLNNHIPQAIAFRDLIVRDVETNTTAVSHQSKYNENGYVFTAAVGRAYWVHWDIPFRIDPARFTLHKMDVLDTDSWIYIHSKYVLPAVSFSVNGNEQEALLALPEPTTSKTGAVYYSRTSALNRFYSWNGTSYNDTTATMLVTGTSDATLTIMPLACAGGAVTCDTLGVPLSAELRNGTLYWSDEATWQGSSAAGGSKPIEGSNINIPFGWNLVIDESPPPLGRVLIEGNVTFTSRRDITFTAAAIIVRNNGTLLAGSPFAPHTKKLDILLTSNRSSSNILLSRDVNAGAKVLAAVDGGTVGLYGVPVSRRWSKLAATAAAGSTHVLVAGTNLGWLVNGKLTVMSSSYNWQQAEARTIMAAVENPTASVLKAAGFSSSSGIGIYDSLAAAQPAPGTISARSTGSTTSDRQYNVTLFTLDQPLAHDHFARISDWEGLVVDLRPEVAYHSSNIVVKAADGQVQQEAGEKFGVRVLTTGPSLLQLNNVVVAHCGQAGLGRPCVHFDRLLRLRNGSRAANLSAAAAAAGWQPAAADAAAAAGLGFGLNPSYLNSSAVLGAFDLGVWISSANNPYFDVQKAATNASYASVVVSGNVLGGSYDVDTVRVEVRASVVVGNLGWGTVKDMSGKSKFDDILPATFRVTVNDVVLRHNAAAGSERIGFYLAGEPCSALPHPTLGGTKALRVANNTAHSSLVGLMLEANDVGEKCSGAVGVHLWRNWDFGVFTVKGIKTSTMLIDLTVAETKHVGVLIMYEGTLVDPVELNIARIAFVGISGLESCSLCNGSIPMSAGITADPTCHPKLSRQSYNRDTPYTAQAGFGTFTTTLLMSPGPEFKPWDSVKGYPTVLGVTRVQGAVFAGYAGLNTCPGLTPEFPGAFAIGNHPKDPDAFHPVFFSDVKMPGSDRHNGLLLSTPPDPAWLNEGDCADKAWDLQDNKKIDMFALNIDPSNPPDRYLPINCGGPRHVLLRDVDGTLSGNGLSNSTILGGYTKERHPGGIDTGALVLPGVCSYRQPWGAYLCVQGKQESGLRGDWKPDPMPATGILGDPQMFVLESRDDDRETRVFHPVMFSLPGSGLVDLVTNAMDQGCCFGYGFCQKRLNAFWTVLPMGHTVAVNFTGSPGRFWRVWLPYADPLTSLLLQFNFGDVVDRRYLWSSTAGRLAPTAVAPTLTDGSPGGSYFWDQVSMQFTLKMAGGDVYEIRTEAVLYVTPRLAMSVDDFWQQKETFIKNLAFVLGINPSRIRVANVIPGSAIVNVEIGEDPAIKPEAPFNMTYNVDMDTSVQVAQKVAKGEMQGGDLSGTTFFTEQYTIPPQPIPDGTGSAVVSPTAPPPATPTEITPSAGGTGDVVLTPDGEVVDNPTPPAPPPPPPPVPSSSPSPSPVTTGSCTGSAAVVCELGMVYMTLTKALSSGSAEQGLGIPIMGVSAQIKADESDLQAAQQVIAQVVAADPDAAAVDLTQLTSSQDLSPLAEQGKVAIEQQQAAQPPGPAAGPTPTPAPVPGHGGSVPPPTAPGVPLPGQPAASPPAGTSPDGPSPPGAAIYKAVQDFKALGFGAALAAVGLVAAVGFIFIVRHRRQHLRIQSGQFTDLGSVISQGPAAAAPAAATNAGPSSSTRTRSQAAQEAQQGTAAEHEQLVSATGTTSIEVHTTPKARATLQPMRSLKNLLSWRRRSSSEDVVLPGAVARSGPPFGEPATASEAQIVGSPKVQTSFGRKESLRQRPGHGQGVRGQETLPASGRESESEQALAAAAAASAAQHAGDHSEQQHGAGRPSGRLPPLQGKWKLTDPSTLK